MNLSWIIVIFLLANLFFSNLVIFLPFQLFHWLGTGLSFGVMLVAIALGSWFIGED
ncbi:MAG: hypothetical protein ACK58N_12835 [Synechocystis sp.]|jgi:hypothetical protein